MTNNTSCGAEVCLEHLHQVGHRVPVIGPGLRGAGRLPRHFGAQRGARGHLGVQDPQESLLAEVLDLGPFSGRSLSPELSATASLEHSVP